MPKFHSNFQFIIFTAYNIQLQDKTFLITTSRSNFFSSIDRQEKIRKAKDPNTEAIPPRPLSNHQSTFHHTTPTNHQKPTHSPKPNPPYTHTSSPIPTSRLF